ncbi:MAG TPA: diaminopimelate decarboxylase [Candidatus Paceibacterota bacterium]|nr:diaminopimelate decarboxylase [Candidatus Paceibacterota bacterium]
MMRTHEREGLLKAAARFGTPAYVYEEEAIVRQCALLKEAFPGFAIQYAAKVNSNPALLKRVRREGLGVETVSQGELELAARAGFLPRETSFTCSNLTEDELIAVARTGAQVHLDSLTQLEHWGKNALGIRVFLRINQGIGKGAHKHWITGGPDSKFGITLKDLPRAQELAKQYGLIIAGLHQHIGSNVREIDPFLRATDALLKTARAFPDLEHLSFGGGFGVPYRPQEKPLPVQRLGKEMRKRIGAFEESIGKRLSYSIEPGRFVIAEAGTLLVSVVDRKETEAHTFVGVNSGFNHLVRPVMYDAHHEVENLSERKGKKVPVSIAGNLCESGDIFAHDRLMPAPRIGDILAIRTAGSCGFAMASYFNMRRLPREVLHTRGGTLKDISFDPGDYAR